MRNLLSIVCALAVVAACGRVPGGVSSNGDYKLYEAVADRSQIAVIDSRSHAVERLLPLGTPSPDWHHLYSVTGGTLTDTDPQTGGVRFSLRLPGSYELPAATLSGLPGGLSQNGRWIAVESFDANPAGLPTASHFLVESSSLAAPPARIDMPGFFSFDAISNDGDRLYLIQYLSANDYRVRMYHVAARQLDPQVIVDKTDPKDSMTGLRLAGIPSQDGSYLYSIYVRENDGPFIHALTLDGSPVAFCIDLPGRGYQADTNAFRWSVAMSADGSHLYAANATSGMVSELKLDPNSIPGVARTAQFNAGMPVAGGIVQDAQAKEFGANAAVITADGKTLITAASAGIVFIDTGSLHATASALAQVSIWSLALSPDGRLLYALSDSGKIAVISMDSRQVVTTFDPGAGNPLALMRVEAA